MEWDVEDVMKSSKNAAVVIAFHYNNKLLEPLRFL